MKILSILAILFGFTQCGTSKLVKSPPFKITSASYNNWVGGLPGVSGTRVEIHLDNKSNVVYDSGYFQKLFFKNKSTKIETREENGKVFLTAHFNTSKPRNGRDLLLSSDSRKEIKNEVPKIDDFPFELKENEAVISYKTAGKIKFYKIENIEVTKSDFYPKVKKIN